MKTNQSSGGTWGLSPLLTRAGKPIAIAACCAGLLIACSSLGQGRRAVPSASRAEQAGRTSEASSEELSDEGLWLDGSVLIVDDLHKVQDASLLLECEADDSDYAEFGLAVFEDGCYCYRSHGLGVNVFTLGRVNEHVVAKMLQDAVTLGFAAFEEQLSLPDQISQELTLTINDGTRRHAVSFTQLSDGETLQAASAIAEPRRTQLIIVHLLAQRVLDVAREVR